MFVCFVVLPACVEYVCALFVIDCVVVCVVLCVCCVCVRASMRLCVLFVACCATLCGLHLMLVVFCSSVFLKMRVRCVCCVVWCCTCVFLMVCVFVCVLLRKESVGVCDLLYGAVWCVWFCRLVFVCGLFKRVCVCLFGVYCVMLHGFVSVLFCVCNVYVFVWFVCDRMCDVV